MTERGFIKMSRDHAVEEVIKRDPKAWGLITIIARRARWAPGFNEHDLAVGEAFLGDFENYGMSEREYRTRKQRLTQWGFATFKTTNKGTIAKLTDSRLFDLGATGSDEQNDRPPTGKRHASAGRVTTNEEGIEGIERKEGREAAAPAAQAFDEPKVPSAKELIDYGSMHGIPAETCQNYHGYQTEQRRWFVSTPGGQKLIDWKAGLNRWWQNDRHNWKPNGQPASRANAKPGYNEDGEPVRMPGESVEAFNKRILRHVT